MEWTPVRIRLFREAGLCLSQTEFAKVLGFAMRTVGNTERGAHPPSLALRRALDQALEGATDAQRDRFLRADGQHTGPVAPGTTPVVESVELLRQAEASDLGPGTVEQLEELVDNLGVEYFTTPPAEFRDTVLSWRRYVARLLDGRLTLRERRDLYVLAGWLSGLVARHPSPSVTRPDHTAPPPSPSLTKPATPAWPDGSAVPKPRSPSTPATPTEP